MKIKYLCLTSTLLLKSIDLLTQNTSTTGMLSLGIRSTISTFSHDGVGLGTGGQFRIRFSPRVNSDWFLDYITIEKKPVRNTYYHIGWSVIYYFLRYQDAPRSIQPFLAAGHCFDYNQKTIILQPHLKKDRWGSAVQAGAGMHVFITPRLDITSICQYMIHFTPEIVAANYNGTYTLEIHEHNALEGHLLITAGLNYKLFPLWKKKQ